MTHTLPPLRLTGAQVLVDGRLSDAPLGLARGVIADGPWPEVDLTGYLILPGIIDLHGDGFERHILPRPGANLPLAMGLMSTDAEAAAAGVTTAYLAQGWSWEGGHRSPEAAEALMVALDVVRPRLRTDLRIQLRVETHLVGTDERLLAAAERHGLSYAIFNDHIDEGLTMARAQPAAFAAWARKLGVEPEGLRARIETARDAAQAVPRNLRLLAEGFDRLGIAYGSHDDAEPETRAFYSEIGARIAEFPTTRRAAAIARSMEDPILFGAPNVVRGGSQSGNVSAAPLVAEGLCDALVSDYHLPALPAAAWTLIDAGLCDLPRAWGLISSGPARVLGLNDRGRLAKGLRADLAIVNAETRRVEATLVAGRVAHLAGEAALRLLSPARGLRLAAE